jgi:hypothetical protein
MTTKPAFPALGAPMSPAWVHGSSRVEELALPKSLKSGNFTLAKAVIRWMSGGLGHGVFLGAVAICVGIEFGAISSVTRLSDHAARSMI